MKRKLFLIAMMSLMAITSTFAQQVQGTRIPLEVNNGGVEGGGENDQGDGKAHPRSPQHPPVVTLDVNTLYFYYIGYDFTLQLLDDDENDESWGDESWGQVFDSSYNK